ncbi:hypothetical protein F4782DRAFT_115076 [Xylaria castorea]|nr:hypothetical protein F4782DRAFT_115076 [Xylaria castorea]
MAEIYLYPLLTLAATSSFDGRGGCLGFRAPVASVEWKDDDATLSTGEKIRPTSFNLGETNIFVRKAAIPAWSWASIIPTYDADEMLVYMPPMQTSLQLADARFTIIDATCTLSGLNPFGRVSGGTLRLKGALAEIPLVKDPIKEPESYYLQFGYQRYNYPLRVRGYDFHNRLFDVVGVSGTSQEISLGESFYCLLVAHSERREIRRRHCLVLKKDRDRTYMRVGILSQIGNGVDWFENVETREIQII